MLGGVRNKIRYIPGLVTIMYVERNSTNGDEKVKSNSDYFKIDLCRLDEEWVSQPRNYHKAAVALADARADYERSKAEEDVVTAELDRAIRSAPEQFDLTTKVTEAMIERTIWLQRRYVLAHEEVIKAKHRVDIYQADVNALDQKKYGLQDLVKLQLSDYFATPRVNGESREKMQEVVKQDTRRKGHKN